MVATLHLTLHSPYTFFSLIFYTIYAVITIYTTLIVYGSVGCV